MKNIKVFLKKKTEKKEQYGHEQYKTLPEGKKQKLVQLEKKSFKKTPSYNYKKLFLFKKFVFGYGLGR